MVTEGQVQSRKASWKKMALQEKEDRLAEKRKSRCGCREGPDSLVSSHSWKQRRCVFKTQHYNKVMWHDDATCLTGAQLTPVDQIHDQNESKTNKGNIRKTSVWVVKMRNWGFLLSYRAIFTWPKPAFPVHYLQNRKLEKKLPSSPTLRKPHDTTVGATPILKLLSENSSLLLRNFTAYKPRRINPCLQDFSSKWNFSRVKTLSFYWGFTSSLFHSCLSPRWQGDTGRMLRLDAADSLQAWVHSLHRSCHCHWSHRIQDAHQIGTPWEHHRGRHNRIVNKATPHPIPTLPEKPLGEPEDPVANTLPGSENVCWVNERMTT